MWCGIAHTNGVLQWMNTDSFWGTSSYNGKKACATHLNLQRQTYFGRSNKLVKIKGEPNMNASQWASTADCLIEKMNCMKPSLENRRKLDWKQCFLKATSTCQHLFEVSCGVTQAMENPEYVEDVCWCTCWPHQSKEVVCLIWYSWVKRTWWRLWRSVVALATQPWGEGA